VEKGESPCVPIVVSTGREMEGKFYFLILLKTRSTRCETINPRLLSPPSLHPPTLPQPSVATPTGPSGNYEHTHVALPSTLVMFNQSLWNSRLAIINF